MLRLYLFIFLASVHGFDTGRVEVNVQKDQISRQEIVFADPFWSVPRVAIHLLGEHESSIYAQIENVSLIGFTLSVISDEDTKLEFEFFGTDDADTKIECVSGIDRVIQIPIVNENAKIAVLSTQGKRNLIQMEYISQLLSIKAEGEFGFCLIIGEPFGGLFFQSLHSAKAISLVQEMTKTNRGLEVKGTHNNPSLEISKIPHLSLQIGPIEKDNSLSLQVGKQSQSQVAQKEANPQLSLEVEREDETKRLSLEIDHSDDHSSEDQSNENLENLKASIKLGIKDTIKKMELEVEQDEIRALNAKVELAKQELKEDPQQINVVKTEVETDLHRTIQSMKKEIETLEDQKIQQSNEDLKQKIQDNINNLKQNEHKFISQQPDLPDDIQTEEQNTSETVSIEDIKDEVEQSHIQEDAVEQNTNFENAAIIPEIDDQQLQQANVDQETNPRISSEVDKLQSSDSELKEKVEQNLKQTIKQMNLKINEANAKQKEQKNVNALKNSIKQTMSKLAPIKNNSKKTNQRTDDNQLQANQEGKQDQIQQQVVEQEVVQNQQPQIREQSQPQSEEQAQPQIVESSSKTYSNSNNNSAEEQVSSDANKILPISLKVDSQQKISDIGDQVKTSIKSTINTMKEEMEELEDEKSQELVKELKQNIKQSVDKLSHLPAKKQTQIVQEVNQKLEQEQPKQVLQESLEVDHLDAPKESLEVQTVQEAADEDNLESIEKEIIATENEVNPEQLNIEKAQVAQSIKQTINQMRQEIQELEDNKSQQAIDGIKSNMKESLKRMSQPSPNAIKKVMQDTIKKIEDAIPSHQLIAHDQNNELSENQLDNDTQQLENDYVAQQEQQVKENEAKQQEIYQQQQEAIIVEEQQNIEEQVEIDMDVGHKMEQEALERLADDTVDSYEVESDNQNAEQIAQIAQDEDGIRSQEQEIVQQNQNEEEQNAEYEAEQLRVLEEQAQMEEERKTIEYNEKQRISEEITQQYLKEEQQFEDINQEIQQENNAQLEDQQEGQIKLAEDLEAENVFDVGQQQQSDSVTHEESLLIDNLEDTQIEHQASLIVDDQNIVEESLIVEDLSNHPESPSLLVDDLAVNDLKEQIITDVRNTIEELNMNDIDSTVNGEEILLIGDDSSEPLAEQESQDQQLEETTSSEVTIPQVEDQDFIDSEIVAVANQEEVVDFSAFNVEEMDNEAPPIETRAITDSVVDITEQELDIMQEDANQQVEEVHYNIAQQINDPHSMVVEIVDDVAYNTITDLNNQEDNLDQSDAQDEFDSSDQQGEVAFELNDEPMNEQLDSNPQLEDFNQEDQYQDQLVSEKENFDNDDQYINEDQYINDEDQLNYDDLEDDQFQEDQLQEDQFSQEQTLEDQLQDDMELDYQEDNLEEDFQQQDDDNQIENDNQVDQADEIQEIDDERSVEIEQQQIVDDTQNITQDNLEDEIFNADVNLDVSGFGEPIGQIYEDLEKGIANVHGFGDVIDDLEWVEAVPELNHEHDSDHIPELDSSENAIQEVIASWAEQDVQQELLDEPPQKVESSSKEIEVVEPLEQGSVIPQINKIPTVSKIESEIREMLKMEDFKKVSDDTLKERLSDEEKYKEEYRKFQEDQKKRQETHDLDTNDRVNQKQINAMENYDVEHEQRKQEIYEQIKTELESKGRIKTTKQTNDRYDLEEAFTNWQRNIGQDIIPSILSHSVTSEQRDIVLDSPQKEERVSKFQEVQIEVEKALGEKAKRKLDPQQKSEMRELRLEDLKYIKDDPLLDDVYSSFLSVNQKVKNLRGQ